MLTGIGSSLIADLIWAPLAWLAYRLGRREWRRHRAEIQELKQSFASLLEPDERPPS
jgi:hypothetical protein